MASIVKPAKQTVLNLDALSVQYFKVQKLIDGEIHEWKLNDQITTGVSLWMGAVLTILSKLEEVKASAPASEIRALQADMEERVLYLVAEVFRNCYPDTEDEWMRATFSHDERWEIVQHFFTIRGASSENAPSAGESETQNETQTAPAETVKHAPEPIQIDRMTQRSRGVARRTRNPAEEALEKLVD